MSVSRRLMYHFVSDVFNLYNKVCLFPNNWGPTGPFDFQSNDFNSNIQTSPRDDSLDDLDRWTLCTEKEDPSPPETFPRDKCTQVSMCVHSFLFLLCYLNLGISFTWLQPTSYVHVETPFLLSCIVSQRSLERTIVLFLRRSSYHNIHLTV